MPIVLQLIIPFSLILLITLIIVGIIRHRQPKRHNVDKARQLFQLRREWLEARFLTLASNSGKPRGLKWVDCDFDDSLALARDRSSGELRGLVGCTIRFEAIEGGGMEDNPNVGNLRLATAVFHFQKGTWTTDGRVLFNLNPAQAIERFTLELETVE
jgi:hypothetical protein